MNEKQISAAVRENGKRQIENINSRRKNKAIRKAVKGKKISLGEAQFKIKIGGLHRTCFKRFCEQCGSKMMVQLSDIMRPRGKFCSQSCRAKFHHKTGKAHPNWRGGDSKRKRKYRQNHPTKYHCRQMTHAAIGMGILQEKPCEVCGGESEIHHLDYSQPFLIKWLCRKHHVEAHGGYSAMFRPKQLATALLEATGRYKE